MKFKRFGALLVSAVLCIGMAAPAFAFEGDSTPVEQPVLPEIVEEDTVTITDEESGALTPEGNLTLVDDYYTNYSDGSGQQFITLVSKSGATFYLVIDRNSKGAQTVHFMNLVDEADLLALMEDFSMRYMLVDGQGNFGSVDGDPPAAYRYTEARMSKIALEMLTDIHKETVPFVPNYDDRLKEPEVLPSRFPNILVNGSVGIAVGMATNIPPHNLGEVIDGIHMLMENPDCTMDELMTCVQGPDFPTGGILMGKSGIRAAYATGKGKLTLRGQTHFEKVRGRQAIIVTEIPYMVNKARLVKSIADLAKDKRIEGISHIQDESSREGMRIVIELKKDANEQIVLNKLFTYTQLQDTVSVNMLALVGGEPKTLRNT